MKYAITSALALVLTAGAVLADQTDRASFRPLAEVEIMPAAAVDRADAGSPELGRIVLGTAELADVDTNRDGKISFEELLQHDLEPGF